MCLHIHHQ